MGQQTSTIATVRFFRQDDAPPSAPDGATWVTDSDGAGNDTASRYIYDASQARWELDSAVGPSEPSLGEPVAGATWRDTSTGTPKQYDGTGFVPTTVSDHDGLDGVRVDQHYTPKPQASALQTETVIDSTSNFSTSDPNGLIQSFNVSGADERAYIDLEVDLLDDTSGANGYQVFLSGVKLIDVLYNTDDGSVNTETYTSVERVDASGSLEVYADGFSRPTSNWELRGTSLTLNQTL